MAFIGLNDPEHLKTQYEKEKEKVANLVASLWIIAADLAPTSELGSAVINYIAARKTYAHNRETFYSVLAQVTIKKHPYLGGYDLIKGSIVLAERLELPPG